MDKTLLHCLVISGLALALLTPCGVFGTTTNDPCDYARINDFQDSGCHQTPGGPGAPTSGAANAGGDGAYCPVCQPDTSSDSGMPRWWVDEPYINVHVTDKPLSYTTSSGKEMAFRLNYTQRFASPGLDQISTLVLLSESGAPRLQYDRYATAMRGVENSMVTGGPNWVTNGAWSHNWMQNIVFWDATTEYPNSAGYPFLYQYEALVYSGDGGVGYFTWNTTSNQTLNAQTQLNHPISQAQLVAMNLSNFTYYISTSNALPQPDSNGTYWGTNCGFKMVFPDGSQDLYTLRASAAAYTFGFPASQNTSDALLTQRIDPQGRVTKLGYACVTNWNNQGPFFRLCCVQDPDGRTTTFVYTNSTVSPWLLQEVDDPFGRKATFAYTNNTLLQSITDPASNNTSFAYVSGSAYSLTNSYTGWLQSLTTPYGTTSFSYSQTTDANNDYAQRVVLAGEPQGASQLFAYVHNTSGTIEATNTSPKVPNIVFDNGNTGGTDEGLFHRNSFHWDREQYANLSVIVTNAGQFGRLTSNDYRKASMKHWLLGDDGISVTETLSSTRDPSPDPAGTTEGQWTWYGYTNTPQVDTNITSQVAAIAQVLPDGTTQYTSYNYYNSGLVSNNSQTYTKSDGTSGVLTNWFHYANNSIDLLWRSNSIGQFVGMGYNTNHQVTSITNALNQVTVRGYDPSTHNLIAETNYSGQSINYSYNNGSAGSNNAAFLSGITLQPEGLTTTIANYTYGLPQSVQITGTGLTSLTLANTWDGLNRLTGTIFPDGTTISNTYANLDLVAHKDRLGRTTHFVYDDLEHLNYITNALINVTTLTWCNCGSLTSIVDPLGNTNLYNRDNQGRLTNVVFADGSSFINQFDLLGRLTNRTDGSGRWKTYTYNNQGLPATVNNAEGQMLEIVYDAVNRPVTITDADGVVLTRTYDLLNRVTTNAWQDGSAEYFQYATNGLIAYTNQDGQFTHYARDGACRVTNIVNNLSQSNQFAYDALDHLISLTDGRGNNTSWNYNQYGWLAGKYALGTNIINYAYNPAGQMTNRWMMGTNTGYLYDAMGNLTNVLYPGRMDIYGYDADNRLITMLDNIGADVLNSSFTYTKSGQLATETGPWASDTVTYSYSQGRRTNLSLTQPVGTWNQSYSYDNGWRLQDLTSPAGQFGYNYLAQSASALFRVLTLPNSASISNYYDPMARLDYTGLLNYWGHPLDGYAYQNDAWGLRTNITRQLGLTTNIITAGYDGIGELASWTAKESSGTARQNEQLGYTYDSAGNVQYRTNGAMLQTFGVNALNQISSVTSTGLYTVTGATPAPATRVTVDTTNTAQVYGDFTFAATNNSLGTYGSGFIIIAQNTTTSATNTTFSQPASVSPTYSANGDLSYSGIGPLYYDAENRLTNMIVNAGQIVFVYDGLNRLRIERYYTYQGGGWVQTNETHLIYDGLQVIQERDTNSNPLVTYTRGLDLSMSLSGAGGIGGMLARTDTNGSVYYHSDAYGNITSLLDGNENIVARYEYDAFGRLIGKWGSMADANRYRFSSKEYIVQAGVYCYGFRFYEPNFQRWLNRDPIQEAGGINLYGFVRNNPVNWIDPYGLLTVVIIGGPSPAGPGDSSGNPFGHASIATTGQGIYSFGTATDPGSSLTDFLNTQATYRNSTVYVLNTTPAQEAAILNYLKNQNPHIQTYPDNCANRTTSALAAAGINLTQWVPAAPTVGIPVEVPINGSLPYEIGGALENMNLFKISVPKGTILPPKFLTGFNPKL